VKEEDVGVPSILFFSPFPTSSERLKLFFDPDGKKKKHWRSKIRTPLPDGQLSPDHSTDFSEILPLQVCAELQL